ncbi:MAG: hypothetical protein JO266_21285 [Acidobacteria bacterium]|nr:hypothetical protein [Acidobacteriota bacterium]MBV9482339.1 hypothetical protein [Acidobacteriota bacterium]
MRFELILEMPTPKTPEQWEEAFAAVTNALEVVVKDRAGEDFEPEDRKVLSRWGYDRPNLGFVEGWCGWSESKAPVKPDPRNTWNGRTYAPGYYVVQHNSDDWQSIFEIGEIRPEDGEWLGFDRIGNLVANSENLAETVDHLIQQYERENRHGGFYQLVG